MLIDNFYPQQVFSDCPLHRAGFHHKTIPKPGEKREVSNPVSPLQKTFAGFNISLVLEACLYDFVKAEVKIE